MHHATYVNRDQEKDFTPSQRTLLSRLHTYTRVGMVPQQNNEKPRPAWTSHMSAMWLGRGDAGTLNDWMSDIGRYWKPPFRWGWSHPFLFNEPEVALSYLRDAGLTEAGRVWSLIERQKKTTTTTTAWSNGNIIGHTSEVTLYWVVKWMTICRLRSYGCSAFQFCH